MVAYVPHRVIGGNVGEYQGHVYWRIGRLKKLLLVLNEAAQKDEEGFYFGSKSLRGHVQENGFRQGLLSDMRAVRDGLKLLVALEVLQEGSCAPFSSGYKRRYNPHELDSVTNADLTRYWRARHARKTKDGSRQG